MGTHRTSRGLATLAAALILAAPLGSTRLGSAQAAIPAPAEPPAPAAALAAAVPTNIIVEAGTGRVIALPGTIANVFVADPKIVEVRPASPTSLFIFGVSIGRSTVAALDANGATVRQLEVTVRPSSAAAAEAAQAIARAAPQAETRVEPQPRRLVVTGNAPTPAAAQAASATAAAYAPDGVTVDNRMRVGQDIQVGLRVRIAEISRNVTRALGINWQAIGSVGKLGVGLLTSNGLSTALGGASSLAGSYNDGRGNGISGIIDALAGDGLVRVLAEPNLVAMSGEQASFLVGGEFPVPSAQQGGTITVEFKQYGVALAFVPTVLSEDRIRLKVRPEVSQLTSQGAIQISVGNNALSIPALSVRRAETTLELGSGQSFAMAGLLLDNTDQTVNALPGIGELPILGALFRSDAFIRRETELVIIVTPYIVRPVNDATALKLPTDGFRPPSDIERLLMLRQTGRSSATLFSQRIPGQAGFVVE